MIKRIELELIEMGSNQNPVLGASTALVYAPCLNVEIIFIS